MISMTGYGHSEFQNEKISCSLEIKSYNNRYLDIILNLPHYLGPLEGDIRDRIAQTLKRGRVEVYLKIREKEENLNLLVDQSAALAYRDRLVELQQTLGLEKGPELSQIIAQEGVLKVEKLRDPEEFRTYVHDLLTEALAQLQKSREGEGAHTHEDIRGQVDLLQQFRDRVQDLAPEVEKEVTRNLKDRFNEIMGDQVEESRILTEVASYLVRYDINEELSRLSAHLISFREWMDSDQPVGKKLDFLCQEMNREINTIGSKSPQVEVHRIVVDAKDAMEKIREQLRNVE